jgi:D-amino-acid dehydrogenase
MDFMRQSESGPRKKHGALLRPLIANAVEEHLTLMQGTDAKRHLKSTGRVKLHRTKTSFEGSVMERDIARDLGVPFEVMSASEFSALEPDLKQNYAMAVRWTSSARLDNPGAVVMAYREKFERQGGVVIAGDVTSLHQESADVWTATTGNNTIKANQIALCTGPWAGDLYKKLGYHFPLGIKRGYHWHYASFGGAKLNHALVDRLTTGAEFADRDAHATPVQLKQILPFARELFPLADPVEPEPWLGSRPCMADSLPVIGPAPRHKGLWLNFGHGHSGLTIGPGTGRLLAELIHGEKTFCDAGAYSPTRFS